jgi:leucyl/phenylalanyl-tRNA---protein transferase
VSRAPVDQVLDLYRRGWFPMDDEREPELPFYAVAERAVFELDEASRAAVRRRVRRSLAVGRREGWRLVWDRRFEEVLAGCAAPRHDTDGQWITPRLQAVYRMLHRAGHGHSVEVHTPGGELAAGLLCVRVHRAAFLESMHHRVPHGGNCLVAWTLDDLAARGVTLCDIQLPTEHTTRLGATLLPREAFEARLREATT